MKNNFLLKIEQQEIFENLSDEDAGKLIKGIFNYANSGESGLDGYLNVIFIPIKKEIDKNEEKYQKICERNKINGSLGGAPKGNKNAEKTKTTENKRMVDLGYENNPKQHDNNHISYITNHNSYIINNHNNHIYQSIIDYLNKLTNSNYKYTTKTTQTKIKARLNEGYTLDDFIAVIDKKTKEWMNTDMEQYLRPETLFGSKFESYLNQKEKKLSTKDVAKSMDFNELMKGW